MRLRGKPADIDADLTAHTQARVSGIDEHRNLLQGHARFDHLSHGVIDRERRVIGQLHEGQLGRAIDRTATRGNRGGVDQSDLRRSGGNAELRRSAQLLFNSERAGADMPVGETAGHQPIRTLGLLPEAHLFFSIKRICCSMRSRSNARGMKIRLPDLGNNMPVMRSLTPQRMPVKYSSDVPAP